MLIQFFRQFPLDLNRLPFLSLRSSHPFWQFQLWYLSELNFFLNVDVFHFRNYSTMKTMKTRRKNSTKIYVVENEIFFSRTTIHELNLDFWTFFQLILQYQVNLASNGYFVHVFVYSTKYRKHFLIINKNKQIKFNQLKIVKKSLFLYQNRKFQCLMPVVFGQKRKLLEKSD